MAYLQSAKFVFHTWSLDLAQPHFASENSEAPSSLLSEPLNRDFRNGVKLDLKFKDLVINWRFRGSLVFILSDRLCSLNQEENNIFNKAKKASLITKLGALRKYIYFFFLVFEFHILVKCESQSVCLVVNQNVTT